VLLWRFPRQSLVLLVVVVAEMVLLMSQAVNFVRNVLPIFPLMLLVAAAGAVALADQLRRPALQQTALLLLVLALLGPQIYWTTWLLRYWSRPHTMVAAAETLRSLPRGMRAAVETHPTFWNGDPIVFPSPRLAEHPLDWYRANGFRYLIVNKDFYSTPEERTVYENMLSTAQPVLQLPDRKAAIQLGPAGALLDLGEHPERMPFVRRQMRFGDEIELLGYELQAGEPRSRITPLDGANTRGLSSGQPLQINLYWRALAGMDRDYTLFIHVVDQQGQNVAQRDLPLRYGDYQTSRWQPGELVIDRGDMGMPALPPGTYMLRIGLYDAASSTGLPTQDPDGGDQPGILTTITIH
jgi:prepilin signal peptidase PulO-like enzyme (type II secretory pathway)